MPNRIVMILLAGAWFGATGAMADTVLVNVQNYSFGSNNAPVSINVGDTVQWVWENGFHTVTSGTVEAPDGLFDEEISAGNPTFSYTFNEAGTYPYFCAFHADFGMMSSIIVEAATPPFPMRTLGGASNNAIAVSRDGVGNAVAAAAAGTKLYLLDPLDGALGDIANWGGGKELGSPVAGRPAFGVDSGAQVVAVGTNSGHGHVFNVATGQALQDLTVSDGAIPTAPALNEHAGSTDIYWAADSSGGPVLVRTRGTTVSPAISLGGTASSVLSSPAVFGSVLIVGTSQNVQTFRVDATSGALIPQSTAAVGGTFNTSPVVGGHGEALIGAADGTVHKINLATGAEDGEAVSLPSGAGPLSDPFYDSAAGRAAFGASDGKVYFIADNALGTPASLGASEVFGTASVVSPVTVSGRTYAADAAGNFGLLGGVNPANLGAPAGKAVAATGRVPRQDVVLVNTTDGKIAAVPLLFGGSVGTQLVADGMVSPIALVPVPDGSGRLFIVEQTGQIRILMPDGTLRAQAFLDVSGKMVTLQPGYDERGLLGLAFHPQYATNGRFFVYYSAPRRATAPAGWNCTATLSEFHVSTTDANQADADSERVILEIDKPQSNHNGGTIDFGPDGHLYMSIGDGGGADDDGTGHVDDWYAPNAGGNGQDVTHNLLGNILRLDVNGALPYAIPPDNPFASGPGLPEIYAYGFRNPYRFSFDMAGDRGLYVGDAGQNLWEEIDKVVKGGNYGWNVKEGAHPFSTDDPSTTPNRTPPTTGEFGEPLLDPIIEFANGANPNGLGLGQVNVGGNVYRGGAMPSLTGAYVFGNWSAGFSEPDGSLFVAKPRETGLWNLQEFAVAGSSDGRFHHYVKGFGQDLAGEVYVLTSDEAGPRGTTGKVFRLTAP